jgi:type III restriction enzyme
MDRIATIIRNRLSLRQPQEDSLTILSQLTGKLSLKKDCNLDTELEIVKASYPTCTSFERNFPSICFSLATGVGKTRLMGAFIAYLHIAKGIRNFFVLAPNLTVYNKLIEDFSNQSSPKYVFQGIGEFATNPPRIITGENYERGTAEDLFSIVNINVFNISKINAETRGDKVPQVKRLKEYIGDSYFNYLSNLQDLVLLMDESHHYRADRGMQVINELKPILGLELTATPQVERGAAIKFKNVVFEYSLAKAIVDGFVKEPAIATRKDFDPSQYSPEDIDRIKIEDGIRIHEDTKVALTIYANDNKVRPVKPFVLVVAKDTNHAARLKELIQSEGFFNGYYSDKVMEIHSNQSGSEKDENIEKLLSLESLENNIEIVIHVNMLKEGWDVTNLYTEIPLRTAASQTLREQTIGRGLRLPYGKRTGVEKVDKLTIVAHDRFQEIIDEANKPDSIINIQNIITIDNSDYDKPKEVITSVTSFEYKFTEEQKSIDAITDTTEKQQAQISLEVKKVITSVLPGLNSKIANIDELKKEEIKKIVVENIRQRIESTQQQTLFAEEMISKVEEAYDSVVDLFKREIIEIPRIMIQQADKVDKGFNDFDLDVSKLNYQPISREILVRMLRSQSDNVDFIIGGGQIVTDSLENIIVNELISYPEIDYNQEADLLFKLSTQAVSHFRTYLSEEDLYNVIQYHKKEIGQYIYSQMMEDGHFYCDAPEYEKPIVRPFTKIEEHNYSKYTADKIHHFKDTIEPTRDIPSKLFSGFTKGCHNFYKFESKTEKDFAIILEEDKSTISKWLRPAQNQFHIYWENNSRRYHPDFVAETPNTIYLIETKKSTDIATDDVQKKAKAALEFCHNATEFNLANGGKQWKYILIPHNAVMLNMSFGSLMQMFEYKDN